MRKEVKEELSELIKDTYKDGRFNLDQDLYDIHNEVFNTDYFIIGYYNAEKWLNENYGIFAAIDRIKEYEEDNFGEVFTDLSSSENVVNMLVYILGEEIIEEVIEELKNEENEK